ncbi:MAG: bifunctional chorismate mutase/prephenate dehydrogenase [Myxococcales bacterium]|nr:bifunctional chorismate mutase/prephenate dehydrogenase [Myxococcales bacterium]USN51513.1 MAG: bifunctional chorismate mutase/prephenate dehydrogenase [Myxococcales bacterium]
MKKNPDKNIELLRQEIFAIDEQIFLLAKRREKISAQIGEAKRKVDLADKDYNREKLVFQKALERAGNLDLPKNFAIDLQTLLISLSLSRQERDRIKELKSNSQLSICVIGGAGRLGSWLCRFFADSGHQIHVIDKIKPNFMCSFSDSIDDNVAFHDIIVVATPIRESIKILQKLESCSLKKSVIFDVSSVKTPIKNHLLALQSKGIKATSLHPMFGPSVEILFGKHIIITSIGNSEADNAAKNLFLSTSLNIVDMSIDEHDQVISYLLSLSHLINIIFIKTLKNSGFNSKFLSDFSSPTFSNLLSIARKVFSENPQLYFEIQALNPHNKDVYEQLLKILKNCIELIKNKDEKSFVSLMELGKLYLNPSQTTK